MPTASARLLSIPYRPLRAFGLPRLRRQGRRIAVLRVSAIPFGEAYARRSQGKGLRRFALATHPVPSDCGLRVSPLPCDLFAVVRLRRDDELTQDGNATTHRP
jgi:hypothetical protein